jgi:serine/threonine protein kinase
LRFKNGIANHSADDFNAKCPLEYLQNKNIFKELRFVRNHKNSLIIRCRGYIIDEMNSSIHLLYDYYTNSIETFIKEHLLSFENKIKIFKNILELIKLLHIKGIISLNLSIKTICFTPEQYLLKIVSFGNSFDLNSNYEIDRNSKIYLNGIDVHFSPEIILKELEKINWQSDIWSLGIILLKMFSGELVILDNEELINSLKEARIPENILKNIEKISNIYIKAIIIGMLRINHTERPNIFEIIDVFNELIKYLKFDDQFLTSYTQKDVTGN